ncbi:TPA: hypothetical protein MB364_001673 [Klebsiella variicola subsp. variicola]|jgi:hypothetical protein|nr:hypothetical protein [Klebsiella variicola subsp. variicola]
MDTKTYIITTTTTEYPVEADSFETAYLNAIDSIPNGDEITGIEQRDITINTKKYIVTIEDDYGRKQYTVRALDYNEAYEYAVNNLMPRQVMISVKLSKIQ